MAVEIGGKSKVYHHGIETLPKVTYQGWEPGREYTKNIVLKNVNVRTQKITYKSPSSRFFSTLYPQPIVLSAGTSYALPVTFRPLDKSAYEDSIKFVSKEGNFEVPIKAVLPAFATEAPGLVELTNCATQDVVSTVITVTNKSELVSPYQWVVSAPFSIDPPEGELKPYGSQKMTVYFKPLEALAFECDAVLNFGDKLQFSRQTVIKGTGKYPHLCIKTGQNDEILDEKVMAFGMVSVGKTRDKFVEVINLTNVDARFKIEQPAALSSVDTVFVPESKKGFVPANGKSQIKITYTPHMVTDKDSVDYFHISTISGTSRTTLKCLGRSEGPAVGLSVDFVDFSRINVGETATRTLEIFNMSETPAAYAFQIDCGESTFKLDSTTGTMAGRERKRVIARFIPQHPINYYRRVACVVENQPPVFLDFIGTAHSETVIPAVLEHKHILQFKVLVERGLSMFPPEHLNELQAEGQLTLDQSGCLMSSNAEQLEPLLQPLQDTPPFNAYFDDGVHCDLAHEQPHVSLDTGYVDFGQCTDIMNIESKSLTLRNYTKGKVTVQWMGDESHAFFVSPQTVDIPPLKTASFRVHFKPNSVNVFYTNELECYCYYKSLRDYRLVDDLTHTPPFCVTVRAVASTFKARAETFMPRLTTTCDTLVFPAVNVDEPAFRTLTLTNTGTNPVKYEFAEDESRVFAVKPSKGVLTGRHQIITFKVLPDKVKQHRMRMKLKLNDMEKNDRTLALFASAESAQMLLGNSGELFFKSAYVGSSSTRPYTIKNISRMPIRFEWLISHADKNILSVTPREGSIAPNENQTHSWTFSPKGTGKHVFKPRLVARGEGLKREQSCGKEKVFPVRAIGEGTTGGITAEQSYFDFGDVVVGSSKSSSITLVNESDCSLHFRLVVEQTVTGPYPENMTLQDVPVLELEETEGVLPAHSKKIIRGRVKPVQRVSYRFDVAYQLLRPVRSSSECVTEEPTQPVLREQILLKERKRKNTSTTLEPIEDSTQPLCHVLATGVFPLLSVIDGRASGTAGGISKKQLWNLFQLDSLNTFLDSDPTEKELRYSIATRHSTRKRPPVFTRAIVDFNFGAAPVGTDPCIVTLYLANTGTVASSWEFLYPSDLQLDIEYWADSGEFDEEELHQMKVMDNKLFTVEPKKGFMEPGQRIALTLTYKHIMAGTDRLPVLLKLSRGREVLLNFIGVTVEKDKPYIHFPGDVHSFAPTPVGESDPPTQQYELYNGGSVPVDYSVDTLPLDALRTANFEHDVLRCLNPAGTIAPGKSAAIEWVFSPLEVKTYEIDLPIHVSKGETALVTFQGAGYSKDGMGETMPTVSDMDSVDGVPETQSVPVPGQKLYLSQERANFGNVPLFSQSRRVVYMKNTSDSVINFAWHVSSAGDEKMVCIEPAQGMLHPWENLVIKITFTALGTPSYYDLDLVCEMIDETETAAYRRKLMDWEREQLRQVEEWTITDQLPQSGTCTEVATSSPRRKSGEVRSAHTVKTSTNTDSDKFKSYKTLPPILNMSADRERATIQQKAVKSKEFWVKPTHPAGFLVHLGVTARTHSLSDFQLNFPDEYSKFYIDHTFGSLIVPTPPGTASSNQKPGSAGPVTDGAAVSAVVTTSKPAVAGGSRRSGDEGEMSGGEPGSSVTCTEEEGDLLAGVLSNILRSLVGDAEFHSSVAKVQEETIPYFQQYTTRTRTNPSPVTHPAFLTISPSIPDDEQSRVSPLRSVSVPIAAAGFSAETRATSSDTMAFESELGLAGLNAVPPTTAPAASLRAEASAPTVYPAAQTPTQVREDREAEIKIKEENEHILRLPEFAAILEEILDNTLVNIMQEASTGEINITARPRLIALPPRPRTSNSQHKK